MANPTAAKSWKGRQRVQSSLELSLPSGNVCLVRPMSIPDMLSQDLLTDSLLPVVQQHINKAKGKPPADFKKKGGARKKDDGGIQLDMNELLSDPKSLGRMLDGIDKAVAGLVVEPELRYHKDDKGELVDPSTRDADVLYTDEVDMDDKLFIFNFMLGGTADGERFRKESKDVVGSVAAGK